MQPRTASPREQYTSAQIVSLIRDWPSVHAVYGCEVLDMDLNVLADISDSLVGGSVKRSSYNALHGEAKFTLDIELEWGTAILRPYVVMSMPDVDARFNLGAYFPSTPKVQYGRDPILYEVTGYDILDRLNDPVGETYALSSSTVYLGAIEEIIQQQGYTKYVFDKFFSVGGGGPSAEKKLPFSRTWALAERATWLTIINELLSSIGYQGIWSDWDGNLRIQRYVSPSRLPSEWTYEEGGLYAMLSQIREIERDLYRAPNRWVFYQTNTTDDGEPPEEGNGIYTVTNDSDGPTSIEGRNGRVITKDVGLDVADHESLVETAQVTIDADRRIKTTMTHTGFPNPLHWHFDRVTLIDPDIGISANVVVTEWELPLGEGDMSHEWTLLL